MAVKTPLVLGADGRPQQLQAADTLPASLTGSLVLREQHTAAATAVLAFTSWYSALYDVYLIDVLNLVPTTNVVEADMQLSTDGGATWLGGASPPTGPYDCSAFRWINNATGVGGVTAGAAWAIDGGMNSEYVVNTAARNGLNGSYRLFNPASAGDVVMNGQAYFYSNNARQIASVGTFRVTPGAPVNAFRVFPVPLTGGTRGAPSGTWASGTIRVYGLAK